MDSHLPHQVISIINSRHYKELLFISLRFVDIHLVEQRIRISLYDAI